MTDVERAQTGNVGRSDCDIIPSRAPGAIYVSQRPYTLRITRNHRCKGYAHVLQEIQCKRAGRRDALGVVASCGERLSPQGDDLRPGPAI